MVAEPGWGTELGPAVLCEADFPGGVMDDAVVFTAEEGQVGQ